MAKPMFVIRDDTRMTYIDLIVKYDSYSYTRLLWIFHWRAWLLQHNSPMELNQPGKARVSQGNRWISLCFEFRDVRGYPKIIQILLLKPVVWDTHILGNLHVYTTIRSIRQSCAS